MLRQMLSACIRGLRPAPREPVFYRECVIYFKQSDSKYTVQTTRDGAMREVDVISETSKVYRTGDKAIIAAYREGTLYIN